MNMENVKLSPPWITFANEVKALFEDDLEVKVVCDEENTAIKLYVNNMDKADALEKIMPAEKNFGSVVVKINIYPANRDNETQADLFYRAFQGNSVVSYTQHLDTVFGPMDFIVCKKDAAQFFNDQMDDINGNKTILYQDVAKDVFESKPGVFFCTEAHGNLSKPLGEWP